MPPVEITHDYYEILEISQSATSEVVKASYRRLAKTRHPDRNFAQPNATAIFQLVSNNMSIAVFTKALQLQSAYDTISDLGKRRDYNIIWPKIKARTHRETNKHPQEAEPTVTEEKRRASE